MFIRFSSKLGLVFYLVRTAISDHRQAQISWCVDFIVNARVSDPPLARRTGHWPGRNCPPGKRTQTSDLPF